MNSTLSCKLFGGCIAGILGSLLMFFSVQVNETMIIDLRHFAIILSLFYGGIFSGLVSGTIIAFSRVVFFGISDSSIMAVVIIFILIAVCYQIMKLKLSSIKLFFLMNITNILVLDGAVLFLLDDVKQILSIYLYYGIISIIGGLVIFYIADYITRSNINYRILKESAQTDFLTGLYNVRQFDFIWNNHLIKAKEKKERLSLLLIDIDHFKAINDTYGHPVGDLILKELGKLLQASTRSFDTVSRNGGEEFSIILPDCSDEQALEIAERIRCAVEQHEFYITETQKLNITVSIGLANYPETIDEMDRMIEQADNCLYRAKHLGRNQVCY